MSGIKVKIGSDTREALRGVDDVDDAIAKLGRDIKKSLGEDGSKSTKKLANSMVGAHLKANALIGAMKTAGRVIGGVFSTLATDALGVGAKMESYQTLLTTFLGTEEAAIERLNTLFDIGANTPFQLDSLIEADTKLEAFGADADKWRTAVMDLAVVMDGDLALAADAVGRALAGGAGAADMLRDRGILSMIQLRTGIKATEMSAREFEQALFETLTDPEGKIAGGTARMAETFDGLMSNIGDRFFQFKKSIADADLFASSKAGAAALLVLLDNNQESVDFLAEAIGTRLGGSIENIALAAALILDTFETVKQAVNGIGGPLGDALRELDVGVGDFFEGALNPTGKMLEMVLNLTGATDAAAEAATSAVNALGEANADALGDDFVGPVLTSYQQIQRLFEEMRAASDKTATSTGKTKDNLQGAAKATDDIVGSPIFSKEQLEGVTAQIERMAGVYKEQADHVAAHNELSDMIGAALKERIIDTEEAVRLDSLLEIIGLSRLQAARDLTAEMEKQRRASELAATEAGVGAVTGAVSSGGMSALSAIPVWGQIITAMLHATQQDESGKFQQIAQNDQMRAMSSQMRMNLGELTKDLAEQLPRHIGDAIQEHPEMMTAFGKAMADAVPELIRGLVFDLPLVFRDMLIARADEAISFWIDAFADGWKEGAKNLGRLLVDEVLSILEAFAPTGETGGEFTGDGVGAGPNYDPTGSGSSSSSNREDSGRDSERTSGTAAREVNVVISGDAQQWGWNASVANQDNLRRSQVEAPYEPTNLAPTSTRPTGGP